MALVEQNIAEITNVILEFVNKHKQIESSTI